MVQCTATALGGACGRAQRDHDQKTQLFMEEMAEDG